MVSGDTMPEEIPGYQPLSALAIVGLLLSLLSGLSYFGPVLWTVPLVAIVLCLLALRRIAASSPPLAGRRAAVVGLVLALFMGGAGIAYDLGTATLEHREARFVIDQFLQEWQAGNFERAHQLMRNVDDRISDGDWKEIYAHDLKLTMQLKAYRENEMLAILSDPARQPKLYWHSTLSVEGNRHQEAVTELYKLTYLEGDQRTTRLYAVSAFRDRSQAKRPYAWRIGLIEPHQKTQSS